jgi:hypothetical protein
MLPAAEGLSLQAFRRAQFAVVAAAGALAGIVLLGLPAGWRMPGLFALGMLFGLTLYLTGFGFTAAYRELLVHRETGGVRAQLLLIAVTMILFAPLLAAGSVLGREVVAAVAPVGVAVAAGAFLFGIGMQLAGGCGSGTLYTLGGGSTRMAVVLVAFCAGSFIASFHMPWWGRLPGWGEVSLGAALGWPAAIALQLALLLVLWALLGRIGRRPRGDRLASPDRASRQRMLWVGAPVLALLSVLTLALAGHPWSITWAFSLWGAKTALLFGWDPAAADFWRGGFQSTALASGILDDVTSVMDIGIVLGALAGAGAAGRFAPRLTLSGRTATAAVLGGLAMGYGARIAYGCNIGAFYSGVASTSLHGWLWIIAALPGCWVGIRLRPRFGLDDGRAPEGSR